MSNSSWRPAGRKSDMLALEASQVAFPWGQEVAVLGRRFLVKGRLELGPGVDKLRAQPQLWDGLQGMCAISQALGPPEKTQCEPLTKDS